MILRVIVCLLMAGARLAELAFSKRNLRAAGDARESDRNRQAYPLIVALHTVVIAATLLFGRNRVSWKWLLALLAVQPLRIWVLRTLGERWNTRGAVPQDVDIETGGPYAYIRHPNYTVVIVELFTLPMAFGLRSLAILASLANAALLSVRIREEERVLMESEDYRAHFRRKARFIPGLF